MQKFKKTNECKESHDEDNIEILNRGSDRAGTMVTGEPGWGQGSVGSRLYFKFDIYFLIDFFALILTSKDFVLKYSLSFITESFDTFFIFASKQEPHSHRPGPSPGNNDQCLLSTYCAPGLSSCPLGAQSSQPQEPGAVSARSRFSEQLGPQSSNLELVQLKTGRTRC